MIYKSSTNDAFIRRLTEIIQANLENENFGVKELVRETGMSRFNLNRKLHLICKKTINQFIRETRLERAMEMLIKESVTASEVSYKVGFSSPAYFSTCFSELFGFPPGEVKKKGLSGPEEKVNEFSAQAEPVKQDLTGTGTKHPIKKNKIRWIIGFAFLSILIILILIWGSNFSTRNRPENQERSIAVLPFINDSQDQENIYFINGVLEAILDNLSRIKDLNVRPRTSVEQYRNNGTKTIPQIAHELGVNYIVEGSGQKVGNQVSLYIQLIEASSDKHLFSQRYNMRLEDIFTLQSEVAMKVASEIKAFITAEERELIGKTPTTNFAALNLFLQANDIHNIAESENKWELDIKAEYLYKKAIRLDSAYADPYSALGWIVSKRNLDSALYLANRALQFDSKNPEAYDLKGSVYFCKGMGNEAEEAYKLSIKYKPNNSAAFRHLGDLYFYRGNCYNAIEYQLKAFHLENNSMQERDNVKSLCLSLYSLGFYKEGEKYAARLLELDNDSSYYYWGLTSAELDLGNYNSALKTALKMYACDTENLNNIYDLMYTYLYLRDFRQADLLLQKYIGIMKKQGKEIEPDYLLGFTYLGNGEKEKADFHFEKVIKAMRKFAQHNEPAVSCQAYLALVKIYSARNEKAKALEYLQKVKDGMSYTIFRFKDFKNCTMLDNIRQEPEFTEYIKQAESRYQTEHGKVAKLLREEGILASNLK